MVEVVVLRHLQSYLCATDQYLHVYGWERGAPCFIQLCFDSLVLNNTKFSSSNDSGFLSKKKSKNTYIELRFTLRSFIPISISIPISQRSSLDLSSLVIHHAINH